MVRGSVAEVSLDHGRADAEWTEDAKRALIARGYELADRALRDAEPGLVADTA
jgi:P2-related tail formation protein